MKSKILFALWAALAAGVCLGADIPDEVLEFYRKPVTQAGVCWDNTNGEWDFETVYGGVIVKTSAINKKTGAVKVTAIITPFAGKKQTASATAYPNEEGTIEDCQLPFKSPVGPMSLWLGPSDYFALGYRGDAADYVMCEMDVGGDLGADKLIFCIDAEEFEPELPEGYELLWDLLPFDVPVHVKGGTKLSTDNAAKVKIVKYEDGDYGLGGIFDDEGNLLPNCAGLKLTYAPKTGVVKGSFKIYAANFENAQGKKPTLKSYSATVNGIAFGYDGAQGAATVKIGKKTYSLNFFLDIHEEEEDCDNCKE